MCERCAKIAAQHPHVARRSILKLAAGAAVSLAMVPPAFAAPPKAPPKPQNVVSPDAALHRLMEGNTRYVNGDTKRHDFRSEREALSKGQNPFAAVLSCADSRIAPEYCFDTARGDLFVCRVAGNFASDEMIASLEYGSSVLGVPLFSGFHSEVLARYPALAGRRLIYEILRRMINHLVTDLIDNTVTKVQQSGAKNSADVRLLPKRLAAFSPEIAAKNADLKRFLYAHLYSHPAIAEDRDRSVASLDALFLFFLEHPERMPKQYAELAENEPRHRVICDYIAGMTDHFLQRQCNELLGLPAGHPG